MPLYPKRLGRAVCACLFLLPLSGFAADMAAVQRVVDATILPLMAEHELPGMAVAVTVDGESRVFNYGLAARDSRTPVTDATLFELGSISKTYTATLVAYAQQQGKLSLDDHPGRHVPEVKGSAIDKATLLELGTYTAGGLPLQFPDDVPADAPFGYYRQWTAAAAPGKVRGYSNPSLGLFGHAAARALGTGFADAIDTILLPQLGLRDSHIDMPAAAMANYAWGERDGKPRRMSAGPFDAETYGIKATAADVLRFVQLNLAPERLEGAMRRAVDATHVGYFRIGGMVQGLGWEQYPYPVALPRLLAGNSESMIWERHPAQRLKAPRVPAGPTLFNKTGSTGGFGGYVVFVPARKIGIVMLANKSYPIPARVTAAYTILQGLAAASTGVNLAPAPIEKPGRSPVSVANRSK